MVEKYNFHWREGFYYNFPRKRKLFHDLVRSINSKQIISIIGLRRTGKTTLLKQLIDHLITSEKIKRENILLFSFDEEQDTLDNVIHDYESRRGEELLEIPDRIYIFLDEIQKLDNWQNQIKYYYDHYNNIKFFISGSSSLFIRKKIQESLAGRIYEFTLPLLCFEEFLLFREKDTLTGKVMLLQDSLKKEFSAYQKRQFIEIVKESEQNVGRYTKTVIEKIVYQDIPKIFSVENPELLMKILRIVAANPGMLLDYVSLSRKIGITRITLSNYFFYLEESFLVKKLYNFSKNRLTSEKKMKKVYLTTTSFFPFLYSEIPETRLIENLIVATVNARFFWRTPQKYEVDLIVDQKGEPLPVEVKYAHSVVKKDVKNLLRFCGKFNVSKAIIITKDTSREEIVELKDGRKIEIAYIPAWIFLLKMTFK